MSELVLKGAFYYALRNLMIFSERPHARSDEYHEIREACRLSNLQTEVLTAVHYHGPLYALEQYGAQGFNLDKFNIYGFIPDPRRACADVPAGVEASLWRGSCLQPRRLIAPPS